MSDQATPGTDTPAFTRCDDCAWDLCDQSQQCLKPVSGTPTNPEATERLAEIRAEVATWEPHWIEGSDGMVRDLLATVDSLLTERDALQKERDEALRDLHFQRVMHQADLDQRGILEATLTRYRNVHAQIKDPSYVGNYGAEEVVAIYRKWVAALDGPKEEET